MSRVKKTVEVQFFSDPRLFAESTCREIIVILSRAHVFLYITVDVIANQMNAVIWRVRFAFSSCTFAWISGGYLFSYESILRSGRSFQMWKNTVVCRYGRTLVFLFPLFLSLFVFRRWLVSRKRGAFVEKLLRKIRRGLVSNKNILPKIYKCTENKYPPKRNARLNRNHFDFHCVAI